MYRPRHTTRLPFEHEVFRILFYTGAMTTDTDSEVISDLSHLVDMPETLAGLFQLPAQIRDDPEFLSRAELLIAQLKLESTGIPMSTMQWMQLARVVNEFLMISYYEQYGFPYHGNAISRENQIKNSYTMMVKEWNRLLENSQDKVLSAALGKVEDVIRRYTQTIEDPMERKRVLKFFGEEFGKLGL